MEERQLEPMPSGPGVKFTDIARDLIDDTQRLIHDEVASAKAEVRETIESAYRGAAAMATGSVFAFVGFVYLALAMVVLLSKIMSALKATLLVGGGLMTLGGAMVWLGKNRILGMNIMPERTTKTLREDQARLKRSDQIEQDIQATRRDMAKNLSQLQQKAKQMVDWRHQAASHSWPALGPAIAGRVLLAMLTIPLRCRQPSSRLR